MNCELCDQYFSDSIDGYIHLLFHKIKDHGEDNNEKIEEEIEY